MRWMFLLVTVGVLLVPIFGQGAPQFSDKGLYAGYLNPGDAGIAVQQIEAKAGTKDVQITAITIRNLKVGLAPEATGQHITRIALSTAPGPWGTFAELSNPQNLNSEGGATFPASYTLPKGSTQQWYVLVWIAGAAQIVDGLTVRFEVKFHWLEDGASGSSSWIADSKHEVIKKAGFELVEDLPLEASAEQRNVNCGDYFLVQRIRFQDTDANNSSLKVSQITIHNLGTAPANYIEIGIVFIFNFGKVERWLGQPTTDWRTTGYTVSLAVPDVPDGSPNAPSLLEVEVWIQATLFDEKADGQTIRPKVTLRIKENDQEYEQSQPASAIHTLRYAGLEVVEDASTVPTIRKVTGGQTLVQRVRVADRDVNWSGIRVDRFELKHLGTAGGNDLVKIEILVKSKTIFSPNWMYNLEALKSGWVWCWLNEPYNIPDEGEAVFEIRYTFASGISPSTHGKTFRPSVRIHCGEEWWECDIGGCAQKWRWYTGGPADYPVTIELVTSLEPTGLEKVENVTISGGTVFDGQRFLAQRVLLEDKDDDTYDIVVHPIHVRNAGNATDDQITKIEVIRKDTGTLLGQTTATAGLGSGGITIPTTAQNVIKDESRVELEIWVTLTGSAKLVAGKTIRLETTVFHTEGGKSFSKSTGLGATFTTAINQPPTGVDFSFTPANPRWDQEITFTPSTNIKDPDGDINKATFKWEFGDGKTETTTGRKDVKYTYNKGGSFTVKLTVIDEYGASAATSKTVTVSNAPPTGLDFSFSPTTPRWNQEVTFTPSSAITDPDGDISKATFKWDFGDGKTVTTVGRRDVKHTYGKGGDFTVSLTVTDAGGQSASTSKKITVTNEAPVNVDFSWTPESPKAGQKVTFKPSTNIQDPDGDIQKATFKWEFGDNTSQTIVGPKEVEHTYAEGKTYTVKLTVTDEAGKSASPVQREIIVRPKGLDFSWTPAQPKVGQTVTFIADVSDLTSPRSFSWDFGDGSVSDARQPTYVYQKAGTFKVSLKVIDAQGKEWKAEKNITVSPASAPVVTALSANPPIPREGEEVTFTAAVSSPDAPVVEWEWDFNGDGVVDSRSPSPVKHKYAEKGLYTAKVRVRSQYGGWSAWRTLDLYVAPKTGSLFGTKVLDNPATTQCRIQVFGPTTATKVRIIILDMAGKVILQKDIAIGTFTWDLKDANGQLVPSGLYLYFVTAEVEGKPERSEIGRILVRR